MPPKSKTVSLPNATLPQHLGYMTPTACEYLDHNKILVSLKTDGGEAVSFLLTTAALIQLVNLGVATINTSPAQIFKDLGVF
jgi:hypothetical protein